MRGVFLSRGVKKRKKKSGARKTRTPLKYVLPNTGAMNRQRHDKFVKLFVYVKCVILLERVERLFAVR